jgi:hypothetical protein
LEGWSRDKCFVEAIEEEEEFRLVNVDVVEGWAISAAEGREERTSEGF